MAIHDLFSSRKRERDRAEDDSLTYDELPDQLRAQIVHIWRRAIGPSVPVAHYHFDEIEENRQAWLAIENTVAEEHGSYQLGKAHDVLDRCVEYLTTAESIDRVLDLIELSFRYIDRNVRRMDEHHRELHGITTTASKAIEDLNIRFREARVGYRFESGVIVRVDEEMIHQNVVKPALHVLSRPEFEGANQEMLRALRHYRDGDYTAANVDANNAFESTLKAICNQRCWGDVENAPVGKLLTIVDNKRLFPRGYLKDTLLKGLPQIRNKDGGHGQGSAQINIPEYLAEYALNLAATNIVLLCKANDALQD